MLSVHGGVLESEAGTGAVDVLFHLFNLAPLLLFLYLFRNGVADLRTKARQARRQQPQATCSSRSTSLRAARSSARGGGGSSRAAGHSASQMATQGGITMAGGGNVGLDAGTNGLGSVSVAVAKDAEATAGAPATSKARAAGLEMEVAANA